MTTELFHVCEGGRKNCWFWTRPEAEAHMAALREVMPYLHRFVLTSGQCRALGIY
jgi:hypothetical protein